MIAIRPRPEGFQRLRTIAEALNLTDGDRRTVVLRALDAVHNAQVRRAFATRGASVASGPWPRWSERYALWRRRHGLGQRMMRLTDTLYEKSTSPFHGGHVAEWRGGLRYSFGFLDDAGFFHQNALGGRPRRSLIDKTESDRREFVEAFVKYWHKRTQQVLRHTGKS